MPARRPAAPREPAAPKPPPTLLGKDGLPRALVCLKGGPKPNWWYFREDWLLSLSNADRLPPDVAERNLLLYQETKETVPNPQYANVGTVWRYKEMPVPRRGKR